MSAVARADVAAAALAAARPVVLVDDLAPDPPVSGALVVPGADVDAATMALLVRETSGVVVVAVTAERLDLLRIPPQAGGRSDPGRPAFAVSVDLRAGVTTGISAHDRAATVRALADPATRAQDLTLPGHVLPVRVRDGGVLSRPRAEEAAVDLCRAAGLSPVAALATVVDDDGEPRGPEALERFAARHGLVLVRVSEVLARRRAELAHVLHDLGMGRAVVVTDALAG